MRCHSYTLFTSLAEPVSSIITALTCRVLVADANPNIQDVDGNTPAHLAQMPKLPTVVSHFISFTPNSPIRLIE